MTSPHFHFPWPRVSLADRRNIFEGYGSLTGFSQTEKDGKTYQVLQKHKHSKKILCAEGPILPLCAPNPGHPSVEPCKGELNMDMEERLLFLRSVKGLPRSSLKLNGDSESLVLPKGSRLHFTFDSLNEAFQKIKDRAFAPSVNQYYTGGSLTTIDTSLGQLLCHPTGTELSTLSISKLSTSIAGTALACTGTTLGSRILQIYNETVGDRYFCAARTEEGTCYTYQIRESTNETPELKLMAELPNDGKPTCISLSPYIEGECVATIEPGIVHLWDGSKSISSFRTEPRFPVTDTWASVHFGSHPRQLIATDRSGMSIWDIRMNPRSEDLFVLPNPLLRNEDRIMVSRSIPKKPFYHILATAETLMMIDERFPQKPVLSWRHSLICPPQYMSVVSDVLQENSDDVILLASQEQPETHCFQINLSNPMLPPISTATPWRISAPADMYNLYNHTRPDSDIDQSPDSVIDQSLLDKRLWAPLAGIATCRNQEGEGMYTIQMTSYGDMFHQKYVTGTADMEKTWSSGPGSSHLELSPTASQHVKTWLSQLSEIFKMNHVESEEKVQKKTAEKTNMSMRRSSRIAKLRNCTVNVSAELEGLKSPSLPNSQCCLCQGYIYIDHNRRGNATKETRTKKCYACRIELDQSSNIVSNVIEDKALSFAQKPDAERQFHLECLMKRTKRAHDKSSNLSAIFHEHWADVGDMEQLCPQSEEPRVGECTQHTTDVLSASTSMLSSRLTSRTSRPVPRLASASIVEAPKTPNTKAHSSHDTRGQSEPVLSPAFTKLRLEETTIKTDNEINIMPGKRKRVSEDSPDGSPYLTPRSASGSQSINSQNLIGSPLPGTPKSLKKKKRVSVIGFY